MLSVYKLSLFISFIIITAKLSAQGLPDSVSIKYLSAIAGAQTDTGRIRHTISYGEILINYAPDSAWRISRSSLKQSIAINYREGIILSLQSIAMIQCAKGHFEESFATYNQAITYCKGAEAKCLSPIYYGIARNYMIEGDYQEAADYFYKAILATDKTTDITIKLDGHTESRLARTYQALAVVWTQLGDDHKVSLYLDNAIAYARARKDSFVLGSALNKKGNLYLNKENNEAYKYYSQALIVSTACHDWQTEAEVTGNIGGIYLLENNRELAKKYLEKFSRLSTNKELNIFNRLSLLGSYGIRLYELQDYSHAEKYLQLAIKQADSLRTPLYKIKPIRTLAKLYTATGNYEKAYQYQQDFSSLNDSLTNEKKLKEMNMLEQRFRLAQKEKILAVKQLQVANQKADIARENMLLVAISGVGGLLFILLLVLRRRNRRRQQLQSEQIHSLQKEQELARIKAVMDGEEKERRRIARELHDGVGSLLSVAKMNMSIVEATHHNVSSTNDFRSAMSLLDQSATELRATAHNLMPEILLQGGIEEALHILCNKASRDNGVNIDFQSYGIIPVLSSATEKVLYRILQELLAEIIPCSKSAIILVQLNWQEGILYITIEVNGNNIIPELQDEAKPGRWERITMYIHALNGCIEMNDIADTCGSTFEIELPLNQN